MGRSKWAWACALAIVATGSIAVLAAEDEAGNPFVDESPTAERPGAQVGHNSDLAERRIEFILDQPLQSSLTYAQTPLNTIMSTMASEYDIPIVFDTTALDAIAVSPDVEVDVNLANITLRSGLELMLKQVEDLTFIIDQEVLLITTHDVAETRLEVRVYRVDDLVREDGAVGSRAIDDERFETLHNIIVAAVEPDSWTQNGTGEGEILRFAPGMLVVGQTHRVHEQIGDLLTQLRAVKAEVEAASPGAAATSRPVTRSFRIVSQDFTGTPESRASLRKAVLQSTNWGVPVEGLNNDELFLEVLPNRVIARHLPSVVHQVERSLVAWEAAKKQVTAADAERQRRQQDARARRGGF